MIRLRGLGLAGEYACTMRCAKGFAMGNGRRTGVVRFGFKLGGAGSGGVVELSVFNGEISGVIWKGSSLPEKSGAGMGEAGGRIGLVGSEAYGEGGGSTKEGRILAVGFRFENDGAGSGGGAES